AAEGAVGDVLPVDAAVGGLPDAAAGGAEVENLFVDGVTCHRDDTPATERANATPFERLEPCRVHDWPLCLHRLHLCRPRPRICLRLAGLTLRCHLMPLSSLAYVLPSLVTACVTACRDRAIRSSVALLPHGGKQRRSQRPAHVRSGACLP